MTKWRTCQVLENNTWVNKDLGEVKKGDKFRLFESSGIPVADKHLKTEWFALTDAVPCEPEGNFSVEVAE